MSLESRIEAGSRRVLRSPLWVGLLITAFLVVPTFLVPSVPLWVALVSLLTLTPLVLLGTYAIYHAYWRLAGSTGGTAESRVSDSTVESPIAWLRHRYATGEIDEATFERKLDRLLETEPVERRDSAGEEFDLLKE
ncbi:hypothetical protein HAPAU_23120 [Halalkalicoccus paucihalophilus]|uniref:SHOCT domain-containing protein n=1 Tax=Halalkalicoccus paucihalophilus TaxID=1008153 RepID=A0A151AE40_9EURY|nr:SHOCT domain-containing protein [Halalkalicoccus paucihalophilus]KYH25637.1 hypothetical protein HAPAU_23120 [Halalkalicoccus paucihalophilus]